jgi:hypothetical protein
MHPHLTPVVHPITRPIAELITDSLDCLDDRERCKRNREALIGGRA